MGNGNMAYADLYCITRYISVRYKALPARCEAQGSGGRSATSRRVRATARRRAPLVLRSAHRGCTHRPHGRRGSRATATARHGQTRTQFCSRRSQPANFSTYLAGPTFTVALRKSCGDRDSSSSASKNSQGERERCHKLWVLVREPRLATK